METEKELQIIREPERFAATGISRVHAWRLERQKLFPARVKLGPNSVGWIRGEISEWIKQKAAQRK